MYSYQRSISTNQVSSMYNRSPFDYNHSNARYPNLQRSNSVIVSKRGFKPSDRFDPAKKEFLLQLSKKIWQRVRIPITASILMISFCRVVTQYVRNIFVLHGSVKWTFHASCRGRRSVYTLEAIHLFWKVNQRFSFPNLLHRFK